MPHEKLKTLYRGFGVSKFYKNEKTGAKKKFYREITNGVILCDFSEEDGMTMGATEMFVTKAELVMDWVLIKFYPPQNKAYNGHLHQFTKDLIYQMNNYGIEEENTRSLDEVLGSEACCGMLIDWINLTDKSEVGKFVDKQLRNLHEDYRWEVEDQVKEVFPFITKVLELATGLVNNIEKDIKESHNGLS